MVVGFSVPVVVLGAESSSITPSRIIELVNESRLSHGLGVVSEQSDLSYAAQMKAEDMLKNQYFSHDTPSGQTPWYWIERAGYEYRYAGENLAIHFDTAEAQHRAWMESPTHRQNILKPEYEDIGIAVRTGVFQGAETTVVAQFFGTKKGIVVATQSKKTAPANNPQLISDQKPIAETRLEGASAGAAGMSDRWAENWFDLMHVVSIWVLVLSISLPLGLVIFSHVNRSLRNIFAILEGDYMGAKHT